MGFYLFAFAFRLFYKSLHHFWVLARMNCKHANIQMRHILFCHSLILIFCINVFEYLLGCERGSICIVAFDPESWSMVVLVVCDIDVVVSKIIFGSLILFLACHFQESFSYGLFHFLGSDFINTCSRWSICY